ncbi:hypothetical protein EDD79_101018 [Serpentinicella alkaliphila]|uniref:Large catalase C-terminal domain-containing protein n=1 Tax=Serpentinicella alkaliphila TaxID=1734049 RepID=A0A4R2TI04_9FIRM|nr:hypothetical protein EDD79_101018 [Serpentinicella alkaliphila]
MSLINASGINANIISMKLGMLTGLDREKHEVNKTYITACSILYDGVFIPGGQQNVNTLKS